MANLNTCVFVYAQKIECIHHMHRTLSLQRRMLPPTPTKTGADDEKVLRTRARCSHHIHDEATKRRNEKLSHEIHTHNHVKRRREST